MFSGTSFSPSSAIEHPTLISSNTNNQQLKTVDDLDTLQTPPASMIPALNTNPPPLLNRPIEKALSNMSTTSTATSNHTSISSISPKKMAQHEIQRIPITTFGQSSSIMNTPQFAQMNSGEIPPFKEMNSNNHDKFSQRYEVVVDDDSLLNQFTSSNSCWISNEFLPTENRSESKQLLHVNARDTVTQKQQQHQQNGCLASSTISDTIMMGEINARNNRVVVEGGQKEIFTTAKTISDQMYECDKQEHKNEQRIEQSVSVASGSGMFHSTSQSSTSIQTIFGRGRNDVEIRNDFRDSLIRATKISSQKRDAMVVDLRREKRTLSEKVPAVKSASSNLNKKNQRSKNNNFSSTCYRTQDQFQAGVTSNDSYPAISANKQQHSNKNLEYDYDYDDEDEKVHDVSFDECAEADSIFPPSSQKSMLISIANSCCPRSRPNLFTDSVIEVEEEHLFQNYQNQKQVFLNDREQIQQQQQQPLNSHNHTNHAQSLQPQFKSQSSSEQSKQDQKGDSPSNTKPVAAAAESDSDEIEDENDQLGPLYQQQTQKQTQESQSQYLLYSRQTGEYDESSIYYEDDVAMRSSAALAVDSSNGGGSGSQKHEIKFNKQFFIDSNDQRSGRLTLYKLKLQQQQQLQQSQQQQQNNSNILPFNNNNQNFNNSSGIEYSQEIRSSSSGEPAASDQLNDNHQFSTESFERISHQYNNYTSVANNNNNTSIHQALFNHRVTRTDSQAHQAFQESLQQSGCSRSEQSQRSTYEVQTRNGAISLSTFIQTKQNTLLKGWVSKRSSNVLMGWQERWLVLKFKRLQYFKKTQSSNYQGCIDFSLLDCSISRENDKTGELSEIRISIMNTPKIFRFRKSKQSDISLAVWANAIQKAIDSNKVSKEHNSKPLNLTLQKTFWKNDRISLSEFQSLADTGDIILFKGKTFGEKMLRNLILCEYNHIGLVLRTSTDDNNLLILEATGEEGVGLLSWKTFLKRHWQDLYHKISLRKLQAERTDNMLSRMESFVRYSLGKPYNVSLSKLLLSGSARAESDLNEDPDRTYFCSELIASIYKVCGFLPLDRCSAKYWPSTFQGSRDLQLINGASLSEEFIIDFSI